MKKTLLMLAISFCSSMALGQVEEGNKYFQAKDYANAVKCYQKAADKGDSEGQYQLGLCYQNGRGVNKDDVQAFYWYKKAAENGNAKGQLQVGYFYENGRGTDKNNDLALEWYDKAAKQENEVALYNLGQTYAFGSLGQKKNQAKAFRYYKKAAELGYTKALFKLGKSYVNGEGVKEDPVEGAKWYRKAAEKGNKDAQFALGLLYHKGNGVETDFKMAAYWFEKAANQGDKTAQYNLGILYDKGRGVEQDYAKAMAWYQKAAKQGHANAQNNIGVMYRYGNGVEQDLSKARYWYQKAIDNGSEMAKSNMEKLGQEQDVAQADSPTPAESALVKGGSPTTIASTPTIVSDVDADIPVAGKYDENTYAVIIGNEKYKNEADVPFAESDARVFREYVHNTFGVSDKQIKFIPNAGRNDIALAVDWLTDAMKVCNGKGRAIFYYAGHGVPDEANRSAYLLPVDGIGSKVRSALSLDGLYKALGEMKAERVLVFLDACFSGAKREGDMMASARGVAIKSRTSVPKGNIVVFTAAQGDETAYSYKEKGHGMFTYHLLRKLKESGGTLTLGELSDYITNTVSRCSFQENNKIQTPTVVTAAEMGTSWRDIPLQ